MSNTWAETVAPGHHYVAGVKLKPLTFGHAVLMERIGLVEILTPLEFHAFIGICSRDYESAIDWLGWFMSPIGQWFYSWKPLPREHNKSLGQAMNYLVQAQQMPELLGNQDNQASGSKFGAPTLQLMRTSALGNLNYTPDKIMDAPFGQLMWDVITHNEINGGAKIIHGEMAEGIEQLKALHKQKANGTS